MSSRTKNRLSAARQIDPSGQIKADLKARAAFKEERQLPGRGSEMVRQSAPKPVLKPSPRLAAPADQDAFQKRWDAERKAAFKATRRAGLAREHQKHSR